MSQINTALQAVAKRGGWMVIGYHVVISGYGFWLPNDPRGSWSEFVRRWELHRYGSATKTDERRSVAHRPIDAAAWRRRDDAKAALMYPPVHFDQRQILAIADGLADGVRRSGFLIYAAALLDDHAHLVIGRHRYAIEQVINRLKGGATRELASQNVHPLQKFRTNEGTIPSPWAQGLWKVFLNSPTDIGRSIGYAKDNLAREGHPPQEWPFIEAFPSAV